VPTAPFAAAPDQKIPEITINVNMLQEEIPFAGSVKSAKNTCISAAPQV
jgi:hypothetical protein